MPLLALVPPSCIVVPKRVVANKFFIIPSTFPSNIFMSTFPSVKEIDVDNNFITRERTTSSSKSLSRSSSISSPHLSYADIQANGTSTGGRVDTSPIVEVTQPINEMQTLSTPQPQDNNPLDSEQNADQQTLFRVNLSYNVNQPINP